MHFWNQSIANSPSPPPLPSLPYLPPPENTNIDFNRVNRQSVIRFSCIFIQLNPVWLPRQTWFQSTISPSIRHYFLPSFHGFQLVLTGSIFGRFRYLSWFHPNKSGDTCNLRIRNESNEVMIRLVAGGLLAFWRRCHLLFYFPFFFKFLQRYINIYKFIILFSVVFLSVPSFSDVRFPAHLRFRKRRGRNQEREKERKLIKERK